MQESTFHSVHRLPSDEWEPPSADALSLAFDHACATRALVAPFLAHARAGSSTTALGVWLQDQVHHAHHLTTLRDAAWLGFGTDNPAAPLRSSPPASFTARSLAGGHTTAPYFLPKSKGHATPSTDLRRGASRPGPSAHGFTLPFQAPRFKMLQGVKQRVLMLSVVVVG